MNRDYKPCLLNNSGVALGLSLQVHNDVGACKQCWVPPYNLSVVDVAVVVAFPAKRTPAASSLVLLLLCIHPQRHDLGRGKLVMGSLAHTWLWAPIIPTNTSLGCSHPLKRRRWLAKSYAFLPSVLHSGWGVDSARAWLWALRNTSALVAFVVFGMTTRAHQWISDGSWLELGRRPPSNKEYMK